MHLEAGLVEGTDDAAQRDRVDEGVAGVGRGVPAPVEVGLDEGRGPVLRDAVLHDLDRGRGEPPVGVRLVAARPAPAPVPRRARGPTTAPRPRCRSGPRSSRHAGTTGRRRRRRHTHRGWRPPRRSRPASAGSAGPPAAPGSSRRPWWVGSAGTPRPSHPRAGCRRGGRRRRARTDRARGRDCPARCPRSPSPGCSPTRRGGPGWAGTPGGPGPRCRGGRGRRTAGERGHRPATAEDPRQPRVRGGVLPTTRR